MEAAVGPGAKWRGSVVRDRAPADSNAESCARISPASPDKANSYDGSDATVPILEVAQGDPVGLRERRLTGSELLQRVFWDVDLRESPIQKITSTGVETSAAAHEFDILVLATGFDASTGSFTQIDLVGSGGKRLDDVWSDGVKTHLGYAIPHMPNMLMLYGPQSPTAFCNGPTCAELQGDWVVECLSYLRDHDYSRIEATEEAAADWAAHIAEIGAGTLFPQADSWYMGANIPGKRRELLYHTAPQAYLAECEAAAMAGYAGFDLS